MEISPGCWWRGVDDVTYIGDKDVPSPPPPPGHEATQVTVTPRPRAMASPAPWLQWTQTQLRHWEGEEEEEEEEDDFESRMDEDGVIGLGESTRRPLWGGGEGPEEGSPAEEGTPAKEGSPSEEGCPAKEGRWHPRRDLEEEEDQGTSGEDEGPWGAESDGEPYPELSYEGQWGSGSSGSPRVLRDDRVLCQPHGCSTDGGDTSGLSDTSPGPATPFRQHRGWGDTSGEHGQGWTPSRTLPPRLHDATSTEPVPKAQPAGTGLPAPGLPLSGELWGTGTPPAPQLQNGSQVPKKAAPRVRPPKPSRQSPSLRPRRRQTGDKEGPDPSGPGGAGTSEGTQYGRGRLNHPLPDLSKVGARVKIDQSYRPPRGRALPARPRASAAPLGFKSPAEIVREVLLSSGEGVPSQTTTTTGLPQEFRSPRQATQLVQQLQDDYHKLLTKYAEAENTIDQLRLGARVSLYTDPPRPSHSLATGTVATSSQVVALSIPRASMAAFSMASDPPDPPSGAPSPGPPTREGSPQPSFPPQPLGGCPTCPGFSCCPGTLLTGTLAGQTHKLQAQVESFESWMQAGSPSPQELLQRFRKLKDVQDALERAYLRARHQHPGGSGDFDPDRTVEGEIFHLGLRLEELKERLEPGARQQLPPQPPAWPRSPETPPQGTAGDSDEVTGALPRRLWQKQLQVEEDFSDLLAQYKHFKSLPESLSLEQLSLAESGTQEEVDGLTAGDGDPHKVPCRTRSLEEGVDLETSPLHPPERRTAPLPPRKLPWPEGTQGHMSPATTGEPPSTAKPLLGPPEPPRVPLSHRSSTAPQHPPHKEQRIVSPETDSGFVGSEASRVSPPVHTPEHRPPGTGTPGSLGPSVPILSTLCPPPRKREVTPLPSKMALVGIYPAGGQEGMGTPHLPPCPPWQSSPPPRWAESRGSKAGPHPGPHQDGGLSSGRDTPTSHTTNPGSPCPPSSPPRTDSEVEGRSCASTGGHPPTMDRGPASPPLPPETPSPTLLSPSPLPLHPAHCDLLGSRMERDRAIRALQDEVWRLQRRLEESLGHPKGKVPPARGQLVASGTSSPKDTAPSGEPISPVGGRGVPKVTVVRRGRSASLPRDRRELELTSESNPSPSGPRTAPSPRKSPRSPSGAVTFRGQYTGTRYQAGMPRVTLAPQEELGPPGCAQCHRRGTSAASSWVDDAARQPQHSTPRRTHCPTCRAPMGAPTPRVRDKARHECGPADTSPPGSRVGPHTEKLQNPGIWYLAGSPSAPPATIPCLAPIPFVPYAPSLLYCSPVVPTSAPAMARVPPQPPVGQRQAEHPPQPPTTVPHGCLSLEELEELNWTLSRAVEVAQSMKTTTTRMSRTLTTQLSRARDLRSSCLF
ncbi:microtubule organization protein AKNA isoform X2 [Heliangelus exortis]|uniref:microtubule organization protein AKNA isoform X2 n=1 Tax=Heliangelus exortis TaxID=472823 RepID=UPI003A8FB361